MAMSSPSTLLFIVFLSAHFLAQAFSQSTLTSFPQQAGFGSTQPSNPYPVPFGAGSVDQTAPTEPSTIEPNDGQYQGGFQQGYSTQNPNTQSSASSSTLSQLPFAKNTRQGVANVNNYPFSNGANAVGALNLMHFLIVIALIIA